MRITSTSEGNDLLEEMNAKSFDDFIKMSDSRSNKFILRTSILQQLNDLDTPMDRERFISDVIKNHPSNSFTKTEVAKELDHLMRGGHLELIPSSILSSGNIDKS